MHPRCFRTPWSTFDPTTPHQTTAKKTMTAKTTKTNRGTIVKMTTMTSKTMTTRTTTMMAKTACKEDNDNKDKKE